MATLAVAHGSAPPDNVSPTSGTPTATATATAPWPRQCAAPRRLAGTSRMPRTAAIRTPTLALGRRNGSVLPTGVGTTSTTVLEAESDVGNRPRIALPRRAPRVLAVGRSGSRRCRRAGRRAGRPIAHGPGLRKLGSAALAWSCTPHRCATEVASAQRQAVSLGVGRVLKMTHL